MRPVNSITITHWDCGQASLASRGLDRMNDRVSFTDLFVFHVRAKSLEFERRTIIVSSAKSYSAQLR